MEGEKAKKDGRTRWESIQMLQRTHAGRKSVRQSTVRKENEELAQGPDEVIQRWHRQFIKCKKGFFARCLKVNLSCHCWYLVTPNIVLTHLLWKDDRSLTCPAFKVHVLAP